MRARAIGVQHVLLGIAVLCAAGVVAADDQPGVGIYRGTWQVVKFDVSPPLRSIVSRPIEYKGEPDGANMVDPDSDLWGALGPQDVDQLVQTQVGPGAIPAPSVSFDGPSNLAGVAPPDPVGDVGPNHYVAMSNLYYQVYDKTGTSLLGPSANNTLWAGFGGDCEADNAGDPIVLYDQLSDRWILTQFTSSGPITFYNCVAVSQTADPTGSYYRWAFSTGSNFPDYPKYGVWPDALFISTREFAGTNFAGVGAYAVDRADLVAGDPNPTVISFLVTTASAGGAYNIGDGLLPADMDGVIPPPAGSPNYYIGSMDNGAGYGAPQDALTVWRFHADFVTPASSTFALTDTIPISAYDTVYPCTGAQGRECIPQPGTSNKVDILSYRQRPMHRAAYRNFGDHEAIVTNQAVEASTGMAGIRWWELRDLNTTPTLFQEGTYAPGTSDGIHRWMGSIAMDSAGNMALGYSASDGTSTYPSVWYTGRLASDPIGTMPQGEESIHDGTGSQTGSQRWGDYSSMNLDPVDDCTFWYVNEYLPSTSSVGWRLRIGAFRYNECGTPDYFLTATPSEQSICQGSDAVYTVDVGQINGYTDPVTLSASGNPAGTTATYGANPIAPPGSTSLTVGSTAGATVGAYTLSIDGTSTSGPHSTSADLSVFAAIPPAAVPTSPSDGAINVALQPTFTWAGPDADSYLIEVATDPGFTTIVYSATVASSSATPATELAANTEHFWRVTASNACGDAATSSTFSFYTLPLPGDCSVGTVARIEFFDDFESGAPGWTHSGTNDSWVLSAGNPYSGTNAFHADDPANVSDQRLVSPAVVLPMGANPLSLQFYNYQEIEDSPSGCYDGGIVEISTDGGSSWTQLVAPDLLTDPYDGAVASSFSNPLAGLDAWCGDAQPYLNSIVDISTYAGQTVRFRFRLGTDVYVSHPGWDIDDVKVQSCPVIPVELQSFNVE